MEELETLYGHIELQYKHLDEIRKNMTYLTRRMGGNQSFNRFTMSTTDVRMLLDTYTNLYSTIVSHIENLYDRTGENLRLRRIQRHPSSTSRQINNESYMMINGRYYLIDGDEAERILNSMNIDNNEPNPDDTSSQGVQSNNVNLENNQNNDTEIEEQNDIPSEPQTNTNFTPNIIRNTPSFADTNQNSRVQRAPFQSQVLDVRRSLVSPPLQGIRQPISPPGLTNRGSQSIWTSAGSRNSYNPRPNTSITPLLGRRNQIRNNDAIFDDVDASFDALLNEVNTYANNSRRIFSTQLQDGGLGTPFFNNITNELMRSFAEPVVVAPNARQIREATSNTLFSSISEPLNNQCPISLETFRPDTVVTQILHCRHIFMPDSLTRWFTGNVRCPVCRYDVRTNISPNSPIRANIRGTHITRGSRDQITTPAYDESLGVTESSSQSSSDSPYPSLEEADQQNEEIHVIADYSALPEGENQQEDSNENNSNRIDNQIRQDIEVDIERGLESSEPQEPLIDLEEGNEYSEDSVNSDDEDINGRYTPPPPPFPQRPPPDSSRFNSTSSRGPSLQNPVIEAVRNILNSPPNGQFSIGPTGITGSFNMNGGTGMGTVETAIFNNIMSNNIENVRFDPSNNQVHFETTL